MIKHNRPSLRTGDQIKRQYYIQEQTEATKALLDVPETDVEIWQDGNPIAVIRNKKHARLIVKAVNSHDELVQALKDYITKHDDQYVSDDEMKYWLDNYGILKMRQALQKAGEL